MKHRLLLFAAAVLLGQSAVGAWADGAALPGTGFTGDHYATLWTKSPFALATPEAGAVSSDYQLVGLAEFDGIAYASIVEKQSQDHFVLSTDRPAHGLSLVSFSRGQDGAAATATVQHNGETLTLQLEKPADASTPLSAVTTPVNRTYSNPKVRFHRPLIVVPPPPSP